MPKPAATAESQQLRLQCLQRLQHLQTQFLHIDSSAELADAEQEGGHILALLLHGKHIEPDSLVANARDILLDYAAGALSTTASNGKPFDDGLALHFQRSLWNLVAMGGSDHQRILLHNAGPAPAWTVTATRGSRAIQQPLDTGVQLKATDRARDYKQQGKRYSLLVAELLARLNTEQATSSTNATGKQGYTTRELGIAIAGVVADGSPGWTAKAVADEVKRLNPDRTVGSTAVGNHLTFKDYLEKNKKRRNRGSGKARTITTSGDALDSLLRPSGRKTKPPTQDDRDDEY